MDCEGGEYDILLTASDATLGRIRRICLEYHAGVGHDPASLAARLDAAGFEVRTRAHPVSIGQGWLYAERRGLNPSIAPDTPAAQGDDDSHAT